MNIGREIFERYCPNCGIINRGFKGEDGRIRMECPRCGLVSVITLKTRRHSSTEEYLSKYAARLNGMMDSI